jgi:hypothetical protein
LFIGSITREDVLRVAKAYLHPDRLIVVTVANLKDAGMDSPIASPASEKAKPRKDR